jgi:hypothetical protein
LDVAAASAARGPKFTIIVNLSPLPRLSDLNYRTSPAAEVGQCGEQKVIIHHQSLWERQGKDEVRVVLYHNSRGRNFF